jgi:phage protein D
LSKPVKTHKISKENILVGGADLDEIRDAGELRSIITKKSHERTWYRITKDMQIASELITKNKLRDWVTQLDKALEDYKPYKINNYGKK